MLAGPHADMAPDMISTFVIELLGSACYIAVEPMLAADYVLNV
jgi:hypothetical protein